jgi:transcriptional regulator with PAS, ATPase and Fis domain
LAIPSARFVPSITVPPVSSATERDLIARALDRFRNDKEQAARALGLTVRTLYRRIKKFGLV